MEVKVKTPNSSDFDFQHHKYFYNSKWQQT